MAGEVFSWLERIRRVGQARVQLDALDRIYKSGRSLQRRERLNGNSQANINTLVNNHLKAITDVEAALDTILTDLLDAAEVETPPLVWKPDEIDGLHHWAFTAAAGGNEAKVEAQMGDTNQPVATIFSLLGVGDVVEFTRAENASNNVIVEVKLITNAEIQFKGNISALLQPALDLQAVPLSPAGGGVDNFTTNTKDTKAEMTWLYDAV